MQRLSDVEHARGSAVLRRAVGGHSGAVEQAAFSPDGRWVVTAEPGAAGL